MPRSYSSSNILTQLPANGDAVELYSPPSKAFGQLTAEYDGTVESLTALVQIQSLPEIELPEFGLEADQSVRYNAIRDLQYQNARFELRLFLSLNGGTTQVCVVKMPLLNMQRSGYTLDLLSAIGSPVSYRVAFGVSIWARIHNVGYGTLGTGDSVIIHGGVNEEAYTTPTELEELGLQRHSAITLAMLRVANLAQAVNTLIDTWDGRITFEVSPQAVTNNHYITINGVTAGNGGATTITPAIFDAIVVDEFGDVVTQGGNVVILESSLPSGVDATLFDAIVVDVDGNVVTQGGNVVILESLLPSGVAPTLFDAIVVDVDGDVVTHDGNVLYFEA